MTRVVGIDPGTVSLDVCGRDGDAVFLDESFPTAAIGADPGMLVELLRAAGPLDLVVGPSGYGLPWTDVRDVGAGELELLFLADAADGPRGTILGGMGRLRGGAQGERPAGVLLALGRSPAHGPRSPQGQPHRHGDRRQALRGGARRVGPGAPARPALRRHLVRLRRGRRRLHGGHRRRRGRRRGRRRRHQRRARLSRHGRHGRRARLPAARLLQGRPGERRRRLGLRRPGLHAGRPRHGRRRGRTGGRRPRRPARGRREAGGGAGDRPAGRRARSSSRGASAACPRSGGSWPNGSPGSPPSATSSGFAAVASEAAQGAALLGQGLAGQAGLRDLVDALQVRSAAGSVLDHLYVSETESLRRRHPSAGRAPAPFWERS